MAAVAVVLLVAGFAVRPDRAIRTATATIAHDLCSTTFVTGSDPDQVFAEAVAPRLAAGLIAPALSWTIDREHGVVEASGPLGSFPNRAVVRPGYGCVLVHGQRPVEQVDPVAARPDPAAAPIAGPAVVAPTSAELTAALDAEFDPVPSDGARHTHGVVILSRGQVVAERYAPGYDPTTPQLGFSMTKSVIATLIGVLVQQGRLRLSDPAPISAWRSADDPRRAITVEQLIRMDSGLDLDEDMSGFDLSTQLVYLDDDIAAAAERARSSSAPATRWHYSGASTHLLARILRDTVGGTGTDVQRFARTELFDPLGLGQVALEMDATGTPIGAHYMLAAPRDWARLGELYRNDGVVGGRRILPEGWPTLVAEPTLDSDYGAGWWTVRGSTDGLFARDLKGAGVPADTFYALGNLGQYLAVIPSRQLVVVRMGASTEPRQGMDGFARLVVAAVGSLP